MRRQIIVGALILAVIIILMRAALGTPVVKRIMESFQSGSAPTAINTMTVCPAGGQMYMYEGRAYCCNGTINPDADDVTRTCRAPIFPPGIQTTFCTLGPSRKGVKNCLELRAGLLQAEGESRCPPSKPNFCQGKTADGRCCTGAVNEILTDCNVSTDVFCDMAPPGSNPIQTQWKGSCDFQRLAEIDAKACPQGYHQTITDGQGAFSGMTIYGCTNMSQTCYSQDIISRLRKMGIDTGTLPPCTIGDGAGQS